MVFIYELVNSKGTRWFIRRRCIFSDHAANKRMHIDDESVLLKRPDFLWTHVMQNKWKHTYVFVGAASSKCWQSVSKRAPFTETLLHRAHTVHFSLQINNAVTSGSFLKRRFCVCVWLRSAAFQSCSIKKNHFATVRFSFWEKKSVLFYN